MSHGLGSGFGGLLLVAVLSGLAGLLGLSWVGLRISRNRTSSVHGSLRYLAIALTVGAVVIAGFAIMAFVDEAPILAAVFFMLVLVPLSAVGVALRQRAELSRLHTVGSAGLAWSVPFLLSLIVTFGVPMVITRFLALAPAEARHSWVYWSAIGIGSLVVILGSLFLGTHVSRSVFPG